ncbi:MAG: hypothetical protein A2X59_05230 [Nitrospirae bacterium GWC2_42_7]|nr:MAG: hypothetical protein A2X59_05230 [Nitrospirae bacterium GWC2_42_7]
MIKSETKKVFFKDVIKACAFKKVKDALLELYPDQKKSIKGYEYVFKTLELMRPRHSKEEMVIDIKRVGRGKNRHFSVSGVCTQKGIKQSYAIEYTPWSKWLAYEVDRKVIKKMPNEEIIAHCLWEMTFAGFTQDSIRREINMLKRRVKNLKEGKVKTIPYEEAMKNLGIK